MKVSCLQENLASGLSTVARAVAQRSTLPVLGNVLVATEDGRLRLSTTNLELGITCWIGAKVEEDGSTTIPARTFVDLVNTFPNEKVEMDLNVRTQTIHVRCGAFNNEIKCIDAQEFPPLPPSELDGGLDLNIEDLREIIRQVIFAASADDARPVLTGVLVEIDGDEMTMAAAISDPKHAAVVAAIITMAHALRLEVVAEGVEDLAELERLRELQCDLAQGHLFAHPTSFSGALRLVGGPALPEIEEYAAEPDAQVAQGSLSQQALGTVRLVRGLSWPPPR